MSLPCLQALLPWGAMVLKKQCKVFITEHRILHGPGFHFFPHLPLAHKHTDLLGFWNDAELLLPPSGPLWTLFLLSGTVHPPPAFTIRFKSCCQESLLDSKYFIHSNISMKPHVSQWLWGYRYEAVPPGSDPQRAQGLMRGTEIVNRSNQNSPTRAIKQKHQQRAKRISPLSSHCSHPFQIPYVRKTLSHSSSRLRQTAVWGKWLHRHFTDKTKTLKLFRAVPSNTVANVVFWFKLIEIKFKIRFLSHTSHI